MQLDFEFKAGDYKEYEVDSIGNSAVYTKESTINQLPGLYYLISWKSYPEEENIGKLASAIQHLGKHVTAYHKNNPKKPTVIFTLVDTALSIARPTIKPIMALTKKHGQLIGPTATLTKKCGRLARSTTTTKQAIKS